MNGLRSIEEVDAEDGGEMFVRMAEDDIQRIKDSRKNQKVYLKLDTERLTLLIRTDGEENWKIISKLKDDCLPFKVLKCAYKYCGKKITREMLKKSGVDVQNKYLRTQVFSDNEAVKTLAPELLEIDKDTIIFRTEAILTPRKLKKLQKLSKI
ncbi:MAG: hypothetical protein Q4A25_00865 [Candidatus Saccharibacteria bacterium]|nr:hypothetical protein [Candidatus Saccharibacteria bacterium]